MKKMIWFFLFAVLSLTAYGQEAKRQLSKPVLREHLRCYQDSDCVLASQGCCPSTAVHKKFEKIYEIDADPAVCAASSCISASAICYEQKCQIKRDRGSK